MATDFKGLIEALAGEEVDYAIIGGVALVLHGSARTTQDLDICYGRARDNLERLAAALRPFHTTLRGLERAKQATGRLKDLLDLAEIAELRRRAKPSSDF